MSPPLRQNVVDACGEYGCEEPPPGCMTAARTARRTHQPLRWHTEKMKNAGVRRQVLLPDGRVLMIGCKAPMHCRLAHVSSAVESA
jgi:hypothetical protein